MTHFGIIYITIVTAISLTGSIFIIRYVLKRRAARQKIEAANPPVAPVPSKTKPKPTMRDRLRMAIYWFGLVLLFVIMRILRLPIPEIILVAFSMLFLLL